jgi:hypothetical protein
VTKFTAAWPNLDPYACRDDFDAWLEKRRALGRNNTAKALYAYYATHINPTAHHFETLANLAGLTNSNKRQTKAALIKAHEMMKEAGILRDYTATAETIKADIIPTESQARAIIKRDKRTRKDSNRRNEPTPAAEFFKRPKTKK